MADELLLGGEIGGGEGAGLFGDDGAEEEFAGGVDDVQENREGGYPGKIAAIEDELKGTGAGKRCFGLGGPFRGGAFSFDAVDDDRDYRAGDEDRGGEELQLVGGQREGTDGLAGGFGAEPSAERVADADHGEETFASRFGVKIVGESPDLRDDKDVDDADPDTEGYAFLLALGAEDGEDEEMRGEESREAGDEFDALDLSGDEGVEREEEHEEGGLADGGIRIAVSAAFGED